MSYYINQNNPTDNESSNNNVPTGKAYSEEEFIEKLFKKSKQKDTHLTKDKIKLALAEIHKTLLEIMEEEGVDEVPFLQLSDGQTVYFSKLDTTAQPPKDQPQ